MSQAETMSSFSQCLVKTQQLMRGGAHYLISGKHLCDVHTLAYTQQALIPFFAPLFLSLFHNSILLFLRLHFKKP